MEYNRNQETQSKKKQKWRIQTHTLGEILAFITGKTNRKKKVNKTKTLVSVQQVQDFTTYSSCCKREVMTNKVNFSGDAVPIRNDSEVANFYKHLC